MKSNYIRKIYLVWRNAKHERRIIVGEINYKNGVYTFKYDDKGVDKAKISGFKNYPDFPHTGNIYTENVLEVFSQRLHDFNRTDTAEYSEFWQIDPKFVDDKYYILAQTQGLLSTDNFEFLAEYYLKRNLAFISEIAGVSMNKIPSDFIHIGDKLIWKREPNNNYDENAVLVFKDETKLGYIKLVHNKVFKNKRADNITITVNDIEKDEFITRVFISIRN